MEINNFLAHFDNSKNVGEVFGNECSYWFATILFRRFIRNGAKIMFDKQSNRFGTEINNKIYDVTGDVTNDYDWVPWESVSDLSLKEQITKNYIMF